MRLRGFSSRSIRLASAAFTLSLAALGCGDDEGTGGGGGGVGGSGSAITGRLCLDRVSPAGIVPPAGVKVGFRVLGEFGDPLRPLEEGDVVVFNDEKGVPFGEGNEGDAVSGIAPAQDVELYSILALDLSSSIVDAGVLDAEIDGALAYVDAVVTQPEAKYKHRVAIVTFGRPEALELTLDFTDDDGVLRSTLEDLRNSESLGSTDLYGAYIASLDYLVRQGLDTDAVVERFLVLLSDGTHESGDAAFRREVALNLKHAAEATIYTIGIQGNYDACGLEELAGRGNSACASELGGCREGFLCGVNTDPPPSCTQFISDVDPAELAAAFGTIAERAAGVSRSNYEIAVCTPVSLGSPSLTLEVTVDDARDAERIPYSTDLLTGAVNECDPTEVRDSTPIFPGTGGGGGAGGGFGTSSSSSASGAGGAGGAGGGGGAGGA